MNNLTSRTNHYSFFEGGVSELENILQTFADSSNK